MGRILWRGKRGRKVWSLGDRFSPPHKRRLGDVPWLGGDMPCQSIDHKWNDDGDHTGHITDCNHSIKIAVNGDDCTELAERIVNFLNMTTYTACIEFDRNGQTDEMNILFQDDGEKDAVLESVFRFWRLRHANQPDYFRRLLSVKIYTVSPKKIDADGLLEPEVSTFCTEWKVRLID